PMQISPHLAPLAPVPPRRCLLIWQRPAHKTAPYCGLWLPRIPSQRPVALHLGGPLPVLFRSCRCAERTTSKRLLWQLLPLAHAHPCDLSVLREPPPHPFCAQWRAMCSKFLL